MTSIRIAHAPCKAKQLAVGVRPEFCGPVYPACRKAIDLANQPWSRELRDSMSKPDKLFGQRRVPPLARALHQFLSEVAERARVPS